MNDELLNNLIEGHFQGTLSAAERQQLDELLMQSGAARKQLVLAARLHVQMFLTLNRDTIVDAETPQIESAAAARGRSRVPLAAPLARLRQFAQEFAWQPLSLVLLAVAAVSGTVLVWQLSQSSSKPTVPGIVKTHTEPGRPIVAHLTRTSNAKWNGSDAAQQANAPSKMFDGMALAEGDRLKLDEGLAEIALTTGVSVVLQGPAELVVGGTMAAGKGQKLAANAATLTAGRLVARVPGAARGFAVDTTAARVVDLGTEFGVYVDSSAPLPTTAVEVFQGRVTIAQNIAPKKQPVIRPLELSAGEAAICEGATIRQYKANVAAFVSRLPSSGATAATATWPRDSSLRPGDIVAVTSDDLKLVKIDPKSGAQTLLATGKRASHGSWTSVAISRRGSVLVGAAGMADGKLAALRINPRDGAITTIGGGLPISDPTAAIVSLTEAADGTIFAAINGHDGRIVKLDPISGNVADVAKVPSAQAIQVDGSSNDLIVAGGNDIGLLQAQSLNQWAINPQKAGAIWSVALGRDGKVLAASDHGSTRRIVEINRSAPHLVVTVAVLPSTERTSGRWSLAVEADGDLIAGPTAGDSRIFRVGAHGGQVRTVSAGGLLSGETFVAVVPQ